MSSDTYQGLPQCPLLIKTQYSLTVPNKERQRNTALHQFWNYVVDGQYTNNLLRRSTAHAMRLVAREDHIHAEVFEEIGCLNCKLIKTELKPGAQPYSLATPCRVPFP